MADSKLAPGFQEVPLAEGFEEVSDDSDTKEPSRELASGFDEVPHEEAPTPNVSKTEAAARGLGRGVTYGTQPIGAGIVAGGIQAVTGDYGPTKGRDLQAILDAYNDMRKSEMKKNLAAQKAHPALTAATQFIGAIPTTIATGGTSAAPEAFAAQGAAGGLGGYLGETEDPTLKGAVTATGVGLGTGLALGQAAPVVLGGAKTALSTAGETIGKVVPQGVKEGFQAAGEGINLLSQKAKAKIMPEAAPTAADKLVNKMLTTRADLGQEARNVLESETTKGTTIDADPAFQQLDDDFDELMTKDSSYSDESSESGKLATKITSRAKQYENTDSLSPMEANNLRDEMYEAGRNVKAKDPYLAKLAFNFADNITQMLKAQVPAYEDAAVRYDQYSRLLPETILSEGEKATNTGIRLKESDNPYIDLKDSTNDMISGYSRPGTSFDASKRTVNQLEDSLSDLVDLENQRAAAAEVEGKPFQSVFDKMGLNKDEIINYIKSKSQRVAAYDLARGGSSTVPLKIPRGISGTAVDIARGGGVYAGNIGGMIYNAPKEVLQSVATKLKGVAEVSHLGQALEDAVNSDDLVKKNAAVFAIMQNPKAKYLIDPSLKDSYQQEQTPKTNVKKNKYDIF